MHYNSIDHFLTVHEPDIAALIEDAERVTGGHYAAMAPDQLHRTAQSDARELIALLIVMFPTRFSGNQCITISSPWQPQRQA